MGLKQKQRDVRVIVLVGSKVVEGIENTILLHFGVGIQCEGAVQWPRIICHELLGCNNLYVFCCQEQVYQRYTGAGAIYNSPVTLLLAICEHLNLLHAHQSIRTTLTEKVLTLLEIRACPRSMRYFYMSSNLHHTILSIVIQLAHYP